MTTELRKKSYNDSGYKSTIMYQLHCPTKIRISTTRTNTTLW